MIRKFVFVIMASHIFSSLKGQENELTLKGAVDISIKNGSIACDFTLINMPRIKDYLILLNTGMNIQCIRNIDDKNSFNYERIYTDTISSESFGYYIPDNTGESKYIPNGLKFLYVGKFPVVKDTLKPFSYDWRGNIAFNGYSLRADGRQSCWYPVLYDVRNDKRYYAIKYDLEIRCSDCNTLYLNGSKPIKAKKARFQSNDFFELMMYAGDYKSYDIKGTYFLNPDISEVQMTKFAETTDQYKKFYENKLGIPYKHNFVYIQTTPVSTDNAWLFVSYPAIINVGWGEYGLKGFFDKKEGASFKSFLAHELGHYYFGHYKDFNSELGDALSEGFGEYLSLQATKEFLGDSTYNKLIKQKIKKLQDFKPTSLADVTKNSDYKDRELYVYNYAPLVFVAIEKEIGASKMWQWLNSILTTPAVLTNYKFLEATLNKVVNDKNKMQLIRERYFVSSNSLNNSIATIQQ